MAFAQLAGRVNNNFFDSGAWGVRLHRAQPRCLYRAQPRCLYRAQPRCQSDILWLRLATLTTGQQKLDYLEKALQANPYNKQTLRLIERLDPQRAERARMMINCLIEIIESL